MSYAINETDLDRQNLLAHLLNRFTEPVLSGVVPTAEGRWLDVGCGQGQTTAMLARLMATGGECVGVEMDPALVEVASARDFGGRRVSIQQGDACALPFDDASFDFVFTRYLLLHIPDPVVAVREMLRVTKPGGIVFAHEPDFEFQCCHPHSEAYGVLCETIGKLFPHSLIGRRLVHLFREAGARSIQARGAIAMEHDSSDLRRIYRISFAACRDAMLAKELLDEARYEEVYAELCRIEADPEVTVIANPTIMAWATV